MNKDGYLFPSLFNNNPISLITYNIFFPFQWGSCRDLKSDKVLSPISEDSYIGSRLVSCVASFPSPHHLPCNCTLVFIYADHFFLLFFQNVHFHGGFVCLLVLTIVRSFLLNELFFPFSFNSFPLQQCRLIMKLHVHTQFSFTPGT